MVNVNVNEVNVNEVLVGLGMPEDLSERFVTCLSQGLYDLEDVISGLAAGMTWAQLDDSLNEEGWTVP